MGRKGELTEVGSNKDEVVGMLPAGCADEEAAFEFFEEMRWAGEAWCPRCLSTKVYQMVGKDGRRQIDHRWRCLACKRQFTVRIGTVLEESRIPLRHWAYAFWRAVTSKKGVSALEIKRQTGLTYKSALFLMHRIRWAMAPEVTRPLDGTVEVDETYVGGKPRYRGTHEQQGEHKKIPVVALVERGGEVRARVVPNVTAKTLRRVIHEHVDKSARLMTDEANVYIRVGQDFKGGHETVTHSRGEYVRGDAYTNTVEGFFSLLKRGIYGT